MPLNEHVTVFLVLQESAESIPDPEPKPDPTGDLAELLALVRLSNTYLAKIAGHFS
jgi:hypothetical protein